MKLSDCLNKSTRNKLRNLSSKSKLNKKIHPTISNSSKEKLSPNDLKELMGENRQTYKRGKGGAVRRR